MFSTPPKRSRAAARMVAGFTLITAKLPRRWIAFTRGNTCYWSGGTTPLEIRKSAWPVLKGYPARKNQGTFVLFSNYLFEPVRQCSVGPLAKFAFEAALPPQAGKSTCARTRNYKPGRVDLAVLD